MLVSQQSSLACKKFFLVKRILLFLFFFKIAHVCVQNINKQGLSGVILLWTPKYFFFIRCFYIGMKISLDYWWTLQGLDPVSKKHYRIINIDVILQY